MLKAPLPHLSGWLFAIILPACHIYFLWFSWSKYKIPVDTVDCTCSCWDTVFKGPYENGISSYKHFYFNATKNVMKIWIIVVTGVILLYECIRYLLCLMLTRKLRFSMLMLFLLSIFPHYYSWWIYINYYNDNFYIQWNHQLFFTVTEIVSTIFVLYLADTKRRIERRPVLIVVAISLVHIYVSGTDQFVKNVFFYEGYSHQIARDFGLMVPDVLHVILPIFEYCIEKQMLIDFRRNSTIFFVTDIMVTLGFVTTACYYSTIGLRK